MDASTSARMSSKFLVLIERERAFCGLGERAI
jgi:hypothetical protein